MKKVLLFAGSNSSESINRKLIEYTSTSFPKHTTTVVDLREFPLPIFSTEILSEDGLPGNALLLRRIIDDHDVFVVSVAEHNRSVTAILKNTLDWLSKTAKGDNPYEVNVFSDKPVLLLGTSPGPGGAGMAIADAEAIIKELKGNVMNKFSVPSFYQSVQIDENGFQLKDELMIKKLNKMAAQLIA